MADARTTPVEENDEEMERAAHNEANGYTCLLGSESTSEEEEESSLPTPRALTLLERDYETTMRRASPETPKTSLDVWMDAIEKKLGRFELAIEDAEEAPSEEGASPRPAPPAASGLPLERRQEIMRLTQGMNLEIAKNFKLQQTQTQAKIG